MAGDGGTIYLLKGDEALELRSTQYSREEDFQKLLAAHPSLMDGEQFDPERPRRWLLVGREVAVSDGDNDRWSLDHLFVDQDAIPTLVEVKRKSDTRLRREVIAQMLDYAANAAASWSVEWLEEQFAARCGAEGRTAEQVLDEFLQGERPSASFWSEVCKNLNQSKVRLVFVADRIPKELQRIVEFLNEQMSDTEVLALELRYFSGSGYSTHVPRVLGRTARTELRRKESSSARKNWSRESFLEDLNRRLGEQSHIARTIRMLLDELSTEFQIKWGTGKARGSFTPVDDRLSSRGPVSIYSDGELQVKTEWLVDGELALAWQDALRKRLTESNLPCDRRGESTLHVKAEDWFAIAEPLQEAIRRSRDETLMRT